MELSPSSPLECVSSATASHTSSPQSPTIPSPPLPSTSFHTPHDLPKKHGTSTPSTQPSLTPFTPANSPSINASSSPSLSSELISPSSSPYLFIPPPHFPALSVHHSSPSHSTPRSLEDLFYAKDSNGNKRKQDQITKSTEKLHKKIEQVTKSKEKIMKNNEQNNTEKQKRNATLSRVLEDTFYSTMEITDKNVGLRNADSVVSIIIPIRKFNAKC
jgi:hypothetical protein